MGTAERKLREKEQQRQHILDTAEQIFFKHGADVVTMDDLARTTEQSKGTLYLYFRNKEALFLAINVRAKKQMREMMEQALSVEPKANGCSRYRLWVGRRSPRWRPPTWSRSAMRMKPIIMVKNALRC